MHEPDPAAVPAAFAAGGRSAAGAVSARLADRRLPGSAAGAVGRGCGGPECHEHLTADGRLGRGPQCSGTGTWRRATSSTWGDGIHCNIRLEDARLCTLGMLGVRADGTQELVAMEDG